MERCLDGSTDFYFTAQTGVWSLEAPKAPSNYYTYHLPGECLARVKFAVDQAAAHFLEGRGFEYSKEFLAWLNEHDLNDRRRIAMETSAIEWETLCRRTEDPKLAYLEAQLTAAGIANRRNGYSWHAPILEIDSRFVEEAWAILDPIDNLPDDDSLFSG